MRAVLNRLLDNIYISIVPFVMLQVAVMPPSPLDLRSPDNYYHQQLPNLFIIVLSLYEQLLTHLC